MKYFCVIILIAGLCHGASKAAECTVRGRFPNDDTEDCRGYTICLIGFDNFTQYKLTCPAGSVYSHLDQQCTNATDYRCFPNYNCTSFGNFAHSNSGNCSSFIACTEGITELVTARLVQCPSNMIFNPTNGHCVNETEYLCPIKLYFPDVVENDLIVKSNVTYNNAVNLSVKSFFLFSLINLLTLWL